MDDPKPKLVAKRFHAKPAEERQNSEMIRRLLYDTIACEFERDLNRASEEFFTKVSGSENRRGYDRFISPNSLRKAVLDKHFISYAQLNALAKFYNIPLSVILLFTRIRDELEDVTTRSDGRAANILSALRASIDHLEDEIDALEGSDADVFDRLGHEGFLKFVATYRDNFDEVWRQPELPV